MKVGLLGAGRIGRIHGLNVAQHKDAQLVAVADAHAPSAAALAGEVGAKTDSIEGILANQSIDAVLICTPTDMHADLVEAAAVDTREDARLSLPLLKARGITRVVIVTHAEHMPRSLRAFQGAATAQGYPLTLQPAPFGNRALADLTIYDWVPSDAGFRRMRYVCYEVMGLLAGH